MSWYWNRRINAAFAKLPPKGIPSSPSCIRCEKAKASCSGNLCYTCYAELLRPPPTGACRDTTIHERSADRPELSEDKLVQPPVSG